MSQSLEKEPDFVLAIDVPALRRDPFFGELSKLALDDAPLPYHAVLAARQIDFFGTARASVADDDGPGIGAFTAVVHGAGDLPADLERCLAHDAGRDEITVASRGGRWIVSNAKATRAVPEAVAMDRGAVVEAWLGPGAMDVAVVREAWPERDMWQHMRAMRIRITGGATPGLGIDARFETSVDAEHAKNDLERVARLLRRAPEGRGDRDEALSRAILEQLPNVHVSRSGRDLEIGYRLTPSLTEYLLQLVTSERHPRERHGCGTQGSDASALPPPPPAPPPSSK